MADVGEEHLAHGASDSGTAYAIGDHSSSDSFLDCRVRTAPSRSSQPCSIQSVINSGGAGAFVRSGRRTLRITALMSGTAPRDNAVLTWIAL